MTKIIRLIFYGAFLISVFAIAQFLAQFVFGINPLFDFFTEVIAPVFYGNTFAAEVVANPSWLVNVGGVTLLRAFAIFSDPHIFSFYLGLVIPLLFGFLFVSDKTSIFEKPLISKRFVRIVFFIAIIAELLTFSRGGYVGMIASFFVMIFLFKKDIGKIQKKYMMASVFAILATVLVLGQSVISRFISMFDLGEGSNVERFKNWWQGLDVFRENFFQGVGIGNYSFSLDPTTAYRTPIYAHNLYLDLGAELGIFALLAWLLLIFVTLYELYVCGRKSEDKTISCLAFGLIGSLVWYSTHSFFDTSIYAPNILSILIVIISLSVLVIRRVRMDIE